MKKQTTLDILDEYRNDAYELLQPEEKNKYKEFESSGQKLSMSFLNQHFLDNKKSEYLNLFYPYVSMYETLYDSNFKENINKDKYSKIISLILQLTDISINLPYAFCTQSITTLALLLRLTMEAKFILYEIRNNTDLNLKKYHDHERVNAHFYRYKKEEITLNDFKNIIKNDYPFWYDPDWREMKYKIQKWTAIPRDSISKMARRNGLEHDYETSYSLYSKVTHLSSSAGNLYTLSGLVTGQPRICFEISMSCLGFLGDCLIQLLKLIELDDEKANYYQSTHHIVIIVSDIISSSNDWPDK